MSKQKLLQTILNYKEGIEDWDAVKTAVEQYNKQESKSLVNGNGFIELLTIIDWMAEWINEVGKRGYCNSVDSVKEKTAMLKKNIIDSTVKPA